MIYFNIVPCVAQLKGILYDLVIIFYSLPSSSSPTSLGSPLINVTGPNSLSAYLLQWLTFPPHVARQGIPLMRVMVVVVVVVVFVVVLVVLVVVLALVLIVVAIALY